MSLLLLVADTTKKDESKAITEYNSCDCKCKFNSTTCNSKQKNGIIKHANMNVKIIRSVKTAIVGIVAAHVFIGIVSIQKVQKVLLMLQ